jgi:hypothetical protein
MECLDLSNVSAYIPAAIFIVNMYWLVDFGSFTSNTEWEGSRSLDQSLVQ